MITNPVLSSAIFINDVWTRFGTQISMLQSGTHDPVVPPLGGADNKLPMASFLNVGYGHKTHMKNM